MRCTFLSVLLALTVFSCGPAEEVLCGPDTCSGCCTGDNKCIGRDHQGYQACGTGGKICIACLPDETCSGAGTCVKDPDAGQPHGDCDPATCQGSCIDGACVPTGEMDAGSCGGKDAPCCSGGKCFLGLSCVAGVCQVGGDSPDAGMNSGTDAGMDAGTPDAGTVKKAPVGSACTANSQCTTGECRILGFPNGYCTKSCSANSDCPSGSRCGADPNDSSGTSKVCLEACAPAGSAASCRTDYVCDQHNVSGGGGCVPECNSAITCGAATTCDARGFCCGANGYACCDGTSCDTGLSCGTNGYCKPASAPDAGTSTNQPIGAACASNSNCASGICVHEDPGGSSSCSTGPCFPGGYCIDDCTSSACPSGSSCSPYLAANPVCLKNCSQPGTSNGCRSGYVCDKNWIPNVTQAICVDACNSDADCNSATLDCSGGFCCGKVSYRCCGGVGGSCPYGGSCGTDGYCE